MTLSKRAKKRLASKLALGVFALAMAGARTAKADCLNNTLDCSSCGGDVYSFQCCTAGASCSFVEISNGDCANPAVCNSQCSDGSIYQENNYCG